MRSFASYFQIEKALCSAGFKNIYQEPFMVTNRLTDHFLYSGKHRPEMYLDSEMRAGISSFHLSVFGNEVENGLEQLRCDIASGRITEVMASYESKHGDYLFVMGQKLEV